jgi:hypothetical protein
VMHGLGQPDLDVVGRAAVALGPQEHETGTVSGVEVGAGTVRHAPGD